MGTRFSQPTMSILEQNRGAGGRGKTNQRKAGFFAVVLALLFAFPASAAVPTATDPNENPPEPSPIPVNAAAATNQNSAAPQRSLFIREFRVRGARHLPRGVVEETVYPFLGPGRTEVDVEGARAALEKAYQDKGYQTVSVQIPPQKPTHGIVVLQVSEQPVGRLRVRNSRYFSLKNIKENAPSLGEGTVPNFNDVTGDVLALNQLPDRRITPGLHAGIEPGTVDVDLTVKDTFPVHGSLELNNRYSADTDPLRLNGSVSYNNLWQLGHSIGASFQISPTDLEQVKVFSGYYVARIPWVPWITFTAIGVKQNSNVSTLGGVAVAGNGEVLGLRATMTLPAGTDFYHSFTLGMDYKHFDQGVNLATGQLINTPITYYPFSAAYSATWSSKGAITDFDASITAHLRGLGSGDETFDLNRFRARGSFVYLRGSIAHTHDLPGDLQLFGKLQGQVASQPLVNSEQFAGGGLATVRGYLEAEGLGDDGVFASLELRSPQLATHIKGEGNDWRAYVFADGGVLTLHDPLPEQTSTFTLASVGIGTRFHFYKHFNGSLDVAVPLLDLIQTDAFDPLVTFRLWADF
jgi:hemolysin activation/secretion protein